MATIKTEIWVRDAIRQFTHAEDGIFLNGLPDFSSYVEGNNTINLIDCGVDPDVLINNTTYPIPIQVFDDTEVPIALDKFQTKATQISDDEAYAIAFDKRKVTVERHANKIAEVKHDKAIHALAPATATAKTFILPTTGGDDGTGRLRCLPKDIITLMTMFRDAGIRGNLRLVLCPLHVGDLLIADTEFKAIYANHQTGKIGNLYGFEVFEYVNNPYYTKATGAKVAFGTTPGAGDSMASVAFANQRVFKANGMTKAYIDEPDTQYQAYRINYRHHFIVLPQLNEGFAALYSA